MKRILFLTVFIAAMAVWCTPGFATQDVVNTDPDPTPLSATGITAGVTIGIAAPIAASGKTLSVGAGQNIFTNNQVGGVTTDRTLSAVAAGADSEYNITFGGSSNVYGRVSGASGIKIFSSITASGGTGTTVNFEGRVNDTDLLVGAGKVSFNSASLDNAITRTNFTGDGTINVAANTLVTGSISGQSGTADQGTLNLMGAAAGQDQWNGAIGGAKALKLIQVSNGDTSGVTSQITGAVSTYGFDLGTNTLKIVGAPTLTTGTGINTTLGSATVYGNINATGAFTYTGNPKVNVTVPTGTYIPLGTLFNIVNDNGTGTTGQTVTVTNVGGTNPLYTFTATPTNVGAIQIQTTGTPIKPATPSTNSVAPIAAAVADALLTLPVTSPVVLAINNLTTADAVANAEAQLAPSTPSLVAPLVTFQGAREFQNLWLSYLDMCGQVSTPDEEKSTCEGEKATSGWWAKGFGYFGQQNDRGAFPGYNSTIAGTMVAYDVPLGQDTRAGLGFGYARTTIDGNTYDTNTNFDTYQTTVYIGHDQGSWFVHGSGSFGWNEYSDRRHIVFPGVDSTANAEYSGQDYTTFVNTGYHFSAPMKFTITPFASLQYSRVNIDSYTDKGAGDADLHVKPQGYDFLESGLGAKVERDFTFHRLTLVPEMHLEWLHELSNPALKQTADYTVGSASFTTPGLKTSPDTFHAGTSLALLSCMCSKTKLSLEVGYDYYLRHDGYSANQATARVTGRF